MNTQHIPDLEPDGGNIYRPHQLLVNSGQFWRCEHGSTGFAAGMKWVGCIDCQISDQEAFAQWNKAETKAGG